MLGSFPLGSAPLGSSSGGVTGPATSVTLSGPSGGVVGVASTNFTVGANGTITGTIIVTPSAGGGGGTFTPTTVSISAGSPTGTFTYTPASSGAKTISVTNNGAGLTNPSSLPYTASSGVTYTLIANSGAFVLAGLAVALTYYGASLPTLPTVGRPVSDTSNSGWLASTGSALYATLDEVIPDDSDYISTTSAASVCQMALDNTAYPGSASQVFQFRASSANGNTVQVRLKNSGGGTVATWTQALTPAPTTYQKALTAGEIALISAGALSLELTAL